MIFAPFICICHDKHSFEFGAMPPLSFMCLLLTSWTNELPNGKLRRWGRKLRKQISLSRSQKNKIRRNVHPLAKTEWVGVEGMDLKFRYAASTFFLCWSRKCASSSAVNEKACDWECEIPQGFFCIWKHISAAESHVYSPSKKQVKCCFPPRWCLLHTEKKRFLPPQGLLLHLLPTESQVLIGLFAWKLEVRERRVSRPLCPCWAPQVNVARLLSRLASGAQRNRWPVVKNTLCGGTTLGNFYYTLWHKHTRTYAQPHQLQHRNGWFPAQWRVFAICARASCFSAAVHLIPVFLSSLAGNLKPANGIFGSPLSKIAATHSLGVIFILQKASFSFRGAPAPISLSSSMQAGMARARPRSHMLHHCELLKV